jgi:hypothetical protein
MASFPNVRPSQRPAGAWRVRVLRRRSLAIVTLVVAAVTAVALSELASFRGSHAVQPTPGFLTRELGAPSPSAPLVRAPSRGVSVAIHRGGYTLATPAGTIGLTADVTSAQTWTSYENGASRATALGSETVAVSPDRAEHFQTIVRRQGTKTWRWKLDTSYTPSVTRGYVGFVAASGELMPLQIDPVQILDSRGKRVTPAELSWGLDRRRGAPSRRHEAAAALHDRPRKHLQRFPNLDDLGRHRDEHAHDPGHDPDERPVRRAAERRPQLDGVPDRAERQQQRHVEQPHGDRNHHRQSEELVALRDRR